MIPNHDQFITAIQEKRKVWIKFYSPADSGVLEHTCAPMDYGPGSEPKDELNRYWLWDYASNAADHTLGLLPKQIVELTVLGELFDPAQCSTAPVPLSGLLSTNDAPQNTIAAPAASVVQIKPTS